MIHILLKLIAQGKNISDYDNKSEKDFIKELKEPKPNPKLEIRIK